MIFIQRDVKMSGVSFLYKILHGIERKCTRNRGVKMVEYGQ